MENRENSGLTLRTIDIQTYSANYTQELDYNISANPSTQFSNAIGTIDCLGQFMIWKNVNMKLILGEDMIKKHKIYNLRLSNATMRHTGTAINDEHCVVYVSGLSFINQTYDHKTGGLSRECPVACLALNASTTSGSTISNINSIATFTYDREYVDIVIELKNNSGTQVGGRMEKLNQALGHQTYVFDIFPVIE